MYVFGTAASAKAAPSRSPNAFFELWRGRALLRGCGEPKHRQRPAAEGHDRARTLSALISLICDSQQRKMVYETRCHRLDLFYSYVAARAIGSPRALASIPPPLTERRPRVSASPAAGPSFLPQLSTRSVILGILPLLFAARGRRARPPSARLSAPHPNLTGRPGALWRTARELPAQRFEEKRLKSRC